MRTAEQPQRWPPRQSPCRFVMGTPGARYIPPPNFGYIEENLYRSGHPNVLNFPFLERLKLKTVMYLSPEEPSQEFLNFIEDQGVEFLHLGKEDGTATRVGQNAWSPLSEELVVRALKIMLEHDRYPLLVMDNLGRHRVGTVIGCFRKLQHWNLTSILEEYRRYAGSKVRILNEQFIELFDTDLVSS